MARKNTIEHELTPICNQMRGFIAEQSIFSHDSSLLFLYSANNIYVHSVKTGECICSLKGHQSQIVSLIIDPSNHLQLISLDKYGIIKIWDYLRCKAIDTIDLSSILEIQKGPIYSSLTGCNTITSSSTTTCTQSIDKYLSIYCIVNNQHIISINMKTKKIKPIIYNVARRRDVKNKKESFQNLSITADGTYLSAIMQREIIIIKLTENDTDSNNLHLISYKTKGWKLSKSLAFHPNNECIAFGDERGGIHLWHDFVSLFSEKKTWQSIDEWLSEFPYLSDNTDNTEKRRKKQDKKQDGNNIAIEQRYLLNKIHWHSHMVSCISFTTDGAYMLSGGEESVLVLTQLETQRQQFLPRLGGPIQSISVSPDEIKFAVSLNSNKIRIIDSINNKIIKTIEGIGLCHRMQPIINDYHQRFSHNPRNINCFVLPSLPGSIQFYDLNKDKSRGILQLVQYPLISRTQQKYPDRYVAQFMQFNQNGTRLVTVIKRTTHSILGVIDDKEDDDDDEDDDIIKMEVDETENLVNLITLQIWHYNINTDSFILNTRIDSPHHSHLIRGVVFHPNKNRFLTFAHNDNHFRIWDECHITKYLKPKLNDNTDENKQDINKVLTNFGEKKHISWKSLMTGYYHKDAVNAANFSNDGTILFIAAGTMLTLWNPQNLMLLKKIDQSSLVKSINTFNNLPYLLTINQHYDDDEREDVVIWDLVQFKKHWSLKKELNIKQIFDVIIIPFKHKLNSSHSLFLIACKLQDDNRKHLILCDMQNKNIMQKWLLPKNIDIKPNSMIIQSHQTNKKIVNMTDKDIDVVFITNNGPIRIPCLYTQWSLKQKSKKMDIHIIDNNDDDDDYKEKDDDHAIIEYLDKISGNNSIFGRIFGAKNVASKRMTKQQLEKQKKLTQERLSKLTPSNKLNPDASVVDDMFSGAPHTLPPIHDMFEQYMSYFVEPHNPEQESNTEQSKEEDMKLRRIGNTNMILNEIKNINKNGAINNSITQISISRKEDIVMIDENNEDKQIENDDDFEMDPNDFDNLRSIITSPININSLESMTLSDNTKKSKKKSKSHKKLKGNNKTNPNGILSSFWNLRESSCTLKMNGMNGWK